MYQFLGLLLTLAVCLGLLSAGVAVGFALTVDQGTSRETWDWAAIIAPVALLAVAPFVARELGRRDAERFAERIIPKDRQ